MFYQPSVQKEIKLLCGAYPRFPYPKGHGFYSGHVNCILYDTRTGKMIEKRMYELLHFPTFIKKVTSVFSLYRCTSGEVRSWARQELLEYGRHKWIEEEEEYQGKSLDEKINIIISSDSNLSWWSTIGTEEDDEGRVEFETNIVSAMANTIVTAGLSLYVAGEKKDDKFHRAIRRFIEDVEEEYEVRWMDELKPFMEK